MSIQDLNCIRPLRFAENHFLEVLLSKFELVREGSGSHLEVYFDSETPACWNRVGRDEVYARLSEQAKKIADYQAELDEVLISGSRPEFNFDDPDFAFRWASAGALPIIRLGSEEYYCLFYREIRPIGWNIANGACDSSTELLDPLQTLERELCEELIILDPTSSSWLVLERGESNSLDRPEHRAVQLILEELTRKGIWQRNSKLHFLETGLKWFNGPDSATIITPDLGEIVTGRAPHRLNRHEVASCFLNINAVDFGIELDRVVKINASEDALIFDGEVVAGKLLNRIVGLFRTDRIYLDQSEFIPDKCFWGGVEIDGAAFKRRMEGTFIRDLEAEAFRSAKQIEAYKKEPLKFDLCPVTRRLMQRFIPTYSKPEALDSHFDVFVSFGSGDEGIADRVTTFIEQRCQKRVFNYLRVHKDHDFSRAIDAALESAQCIVAVGSRLEHLTSRWPEYEYRTFNVDVQSGKKPGGKLLSLVVGLDPTELPLPLRRFTVKSCQTEADLHIALEQLLPYLS
jgi:hypothetical protein